MDGRLQVVPGSWARYDRIAWVMLPQNKYITPKVRSFIDFLVESFIPGLSKSPHLFGSDEVALTEGRRRGA
jgi:DNA-binding transcriptional LysR family regulator